MPGRYGVRIVGDDDYLYPSALDNDPETIEHLEDGTWGVYGVVVVHVGECGDVHLDYGHALWGIVAESTTLEGCDVWNLSEISDDYLREVARELVSEATS